MSEAKHTSGPWRTSRGTVDVYNKDGFTIIECNHYGISDKEEAFANQQLIAAAPDMLDALEQILPEIECRCGQAYTGRGLHESNSLCHHVEAVKSAIAKATGKEVKQ